MHSHSIVGELFYLQYARVRYGPKIQLVRIRYAQ